MEDLLCTLFKCGWMDLRFLKNLLEKYYLDIDIEWEDVIQSPYEFNINYIIYITFESIKDKFMSDMEEELTTICTAEDLSSEIDYTIYTNYLDSHLWFNNQSIQDLFENWQERYEPELANN